MELSPQDTLRLNVLLANKPQAIRINESNMTVFGLSANAEVKVQLHPSGRSDQYLKSVKELLSGHVLGSPGGYPVYLQRWTRMGQMRDDSLEQLLLLGEPEAVVAAVTAQGLTNELARRAWWVMEDAANARHMLRKQAVVNGDMGPLLAAYLVEHLPFESEPEQQIETVALVLQPGLLSLEETASLWRKAQRKPAYYVGFIAACPDELPEPAPAHPAAGDRALAELASQGNPLAGLLRRTFEPAGQAFLATLYRIFDRPSNQEVVNQALDAVARYFAAARPDGDVDMTFEALVNEAAIWLDGDANGQAVLQISPVTKQQVQALRILSGLSYGVVRPVFGDSTAIGSLMRRKLEPLLEPLLETVSCLNAAGNSPSTSRGGQSRSSRRGRHR